MAKPLQLRKLKAQMALKELDLETVARRAKVVYCTASEVLNGRRIDPLRLSKLSAVIEKAPMPEEAKAK